MSNPQVILFKAELDADGVVTGLRAVEGEFKGTAQEATKSVDGLSKSWSMLGKTVGTILVSREALRFVNSSITASREADRVNRGLEQTLRTTGNVVGLTSRQLSMMADELQGVSGVSNDVIKGAQNLLLTFRSLQGEGFERTMRLAMDMSEVIDQDLNSSVKDLGRLLENPIRGMQLLERRGQGLTAQQKELVKEFLATNQLGEAQAVILSRLESVYSGAAAAGADAAQKLSSSWKQAKEEIGSFLDTALNLTFIFGAIASGLNKLVKAERAHAEAVKNSRETHRLHTNLTVEELQTYVSAIQDGIAATKEELQATERGSAAREQLIKRLFDQTAQLRKYEKALADTTKREQAAADARSIPIPPPDPAELRQRAQDAAEAIKDGLRQAKLAEGVVDVMFDPAIVGREIAKRFGQGEAAGLGGQLAQAMGLTREGGTAMGQRLGEGLASALNRSFRTEYRQLGLEDFLDPEAFRFLTTGEVGLGRPGRVDLSEFSSAWKKEQRAQEQWSMLGRSVGDALWMGMSDAVLAGFGTDGFRDAIRGIFQSIGQASGDALSRQLMDALFGYIGPDGSKEAGLVGAGGLGSMYGDLSPSERLGVGIAHLIGGQLQQSQSRSKAAAGGALSGAASMYSTGNPWAMLGGAIVGGIMSYLGSKKPDKTPYSLGINPYGQRGWASIGGYDTSEERELGRQMEDRWKSVNLGFRRMLMLAGAPLGDMRTDEWRETGKTYDLQSILSRVLGSTLPQAILGSYKEDLTEAFTGRWGVTDDRMSAWWMQFESGTFDSSMESFMSWAQALSNLGSARDTLGMSSEEFRAEAGEGTIAGWRRQVNEALSEIDRLSAGVEDLTTEEAVERAEEVARLAEAARAANLELMRSILAMIDEAQQRLSSWQEQWAGDRARREGGVTGAREFATAAFRRATSGVSGAQDMAELSRFLSDAERWAGVLSSIAQEFDALADAGEELAEELRDLVAEMAEPLATTLGREGIGGWRAGLDDTISKMGQLRQSFDSLIGQERLNTARQLGDMARQQYQENLNMLRQILSLSRSAAAAWDDMFLSMELDEAAKGGPAALGQDLVDRILALYDELRDAGDPTEVDAIARKIREFASRLWGLDERILVELGGEQMDLFAWLRPFLEQVKDLEQQRYDDFGIEVEDGQQRLRDAFGNFAEDVGTVAQEWRTAAEELRALIETDLTEAFEVAQDRLREWADEIDEANRRFRDATDPLWGALTGEIVLRNDLSQAILDEIDRRRRFGDELDRGADELIQFRMALQDASGELGWFGGAAGAAAAGAVTMGTLLARAPGALGAGVG